MALLKIDLSPERRALRQFAIIWLVAFISIGAWIGLKHSFLFFRFSAESASIIGWTLGVVGAVGGLIGSIVPKTILPIYLTLMLIALPIGFFISYLVTAIVFYGVITPVGLVRRALGHDSLSRSIHSTHTSYWKAKTTDTDVARYFRQY